MTNETIIFHALSSKIAFETEQLGTFKNWIINDYIKSDVL